MAIFSEMCVDFDPAGPFSLVNDTGRFRSVMIFISWGNPFVNFHFMGESLCTDFDPKWPAGPKFGPEMAIFSEMCVDSIESVDISAFLVEFGPAGRPGQPKRPRCQRVQLNPCTSQSIFSEMCMGTLNSMQISVCQIRKVRSAWIQLNTCTSRPFLIDPCRSRC